MGFWMDFVEFCYSLVFVIRNSLPCHGIFHRAAAVVTVDEWRVGLGKGGEGREGGERFELKRISRSIA